MPLLSKSPAAKTSIIYITVGTLIVVWTVIWYAYLINEATRTDYGYYWCTGFMLTGLALIVLGLVMGPVGRAARHAELPPKESTPAAERAEQNAAARAPLATDNPANTKSTTEPAATPGIKPVR